MHTHNRGPDMSDYPFIPELPDPPLRSDGRVDFARKGSVFLGAFPARRSGFNDSGAWIQSTINNLADYLGLTEQARDEAIDALNSAQLAAQLSADRAAESEGWASHSHMYSTMAAATAAYKGEWGDLTGPLSVPAST